MASELNIHQRMALVMEMVPRVQKEQYNQHHRYAYVGHEDLTSALQPAFVKAGIVQLVDVLETGRHEGVLWVRCMVAWCNVDDPKDSVSVNAYGESQPGGKGGPQPQQVGVAISYAVKFAQQKCFSIRTDDIPDADADPVGAPAPAEEQEPWAERIVQAKTPGELKEVAQRIMKQRTSIPAPQYAALAAKVGERMKEISK